MGIVVSECIKDNVNDLAHDGRTWDAAKYLANNIDPNGLGEIFNATTAIGNRGDIDQASIAMLEMSALTALYKFVKFNVYDNDIFLEWIL